jgi:energy-coupling factor transporter ATP-binding protein EcfA2
MNVISSAPRVGSPFPGLRPFKSDEDAIFFGRHEQVSDMLQRLETCRLLTVVGASGCGKSSLVRAGLLPALQEGLLFGTGSDWTMVTLKPDSTPYPELAKALSDALPRTRPSDANDWRPYIKAMLLSGENGLIRVINEAGLPPGSNVLVLVDQFEELFRFRSAAYTQGQDNPEKQHALYEERNTANAFVNLLLETVCRQSGSEDVSGWRNGGTSGLIPKHPIFVVLTMRSEFLGHCDAFLGLPEAVSHSQFLTPRMTRDQLKDAIVCPLQLFGATAHPALVNRILNDVGTDPDSLPLMQHALLRTWQNAKERSAEEPLERRQKVELTTVDYEKAGGLKRALSLHADEAYAELEREPVLGESYCRIAQQLFLLLCHQTGEGVMVRNPIRVTEAAATAGVSAEAILHVAAAFSKEGRNFLTFSSNNHHLTEESGLDISHESLIRNWDTFKEWIKTEGKCAADYAWLLQAAERWKAGGDLFHGPNLRIALAWKQKARPLARWAAKYGGDFDLAMRFLEESKKRHRCHLLLAALLAGFVILAPFVYAIQRMSLLGKLAEEQHIQLKTQSDLLKANGQLREIADLAKRQSQDLSGKAEELLKDKNDPRAPVLALAQLSRALDRDRHNVAAAERACTLLMNYTWFPPLIPPLRYRSESPILTATFDPEGKGNRVLAISQNGWLLRSDDQEKALVRIQPLIEQPDSKNSGLVSASFSPDGRALVFIYPTANGQKCIQFCGYEKGQYKPVTTFEIDSYSLYNTVNWSADGKLITIIPVRWDATGSCRAFYFDGTSYFTVDKPFGESQVVAVAFDPTTNVIATAFPNGSNGSLQFWNWNGSSFKQLPETPASHSTCILPNGRIRSVVFGKAKEELFAVTYGSLNVQVQRVNVPLNRVEILGRVTAPRDQFLRLITGPSLSGRQLIATSLYQRLTIDYSDDWSLASSLAQPICFQGTTAIATFDLTGSRLMTLSGSNWLSPETVQIWDVSMKTKGEAVGEFHAEDQPAPPWLASLARAVSGIPRAWDSDDGSAVLSDVFEQSASTVRDTPYSPYNRVWNHFFPGSALEIGASAEKGSPATVVTDR